MSEHFKVGYPNIQSSQIVVREIKIKIKYYSTLTKMAKKKKKIDNTVGKKMERLEFSYTAKGVYNNNKLAAVTKAEFIYTLCPVILTYNLIYIVTL